jgi:ferrochelatase
MAMGGPDGLENIEPYLREVRGGRPTSPEFIEEIRDRYRATGGKSPVLGITRSVAQQLEQRLNGPGGERYRVYVGLRHWKPFIQETYAELMDDCPERMIGLCMAPQYSAMSIGAYMKKVEEARAQLGGAFPVSYVKSWHNHPLLIRAIADQVTQALGKFSADVRPKVPILFTAHSLPTRILETKDPYPDEVRATMASVCQALGQPTARFAFQSQGRSDEPWLGPTVEETLEALIADGHRHVLVAPIGFLSDHLEVLYDIDIQFKEFAAARGMQLERMTMLNAAPPLVDTLASVVHEHESAHPA